MIVQTLKQALPTITLHTRSIIILLFKPMFKLPFVVQVAASKTTLFSTGMQETNQNLVTTEYYRIACAIILFSSTVPTERLNRIGVGVTFPTHIHIY